MSGREGGLVMDGWWEWEGEEVVEVGVDVVKDGGGGGGGSDGLKGSGCGDGMAVMTGLVVVVVSSVRERACEKAVRGRAKNCCASCAKVCEQMVQRKV